MFSKREREGYLMIDHRNSPGIDTTSAARIPGLPVGAGTFYQSPTVNCPYCERMIIMNPDRSRARNYDRKTDAYICDRCALIAKVGGELKPFKQVIDEFVDRMANAA